MIKPEEKTDDAPYQKGSDKKAAGFREPNESHRNEAKHDHQPNRMACVLAAAVRTEWHNVSFCGSILAQRCSAQ